jgi:hypothetical protein
MCEIACEVTQKCDVDQWSFKAYLARWLAVSAQLAPYTAAQITPLLATSAKAAAKQCNGGTSGTECGSRWYQDTCDGNVGVGQQMSALSVISANLIASGKGLLSADTGGTSQGNVAAGTGGEEKDPTVLDAITTADRAGAGIVTAIVLVAMMGGGWFIVTEN